MPPRHTYWTIILEGKPTAFRAHTQEELLPTLRQLQSRHPDAVLMWFARGRLWKSEEESRAALVRKRPVEERRGPAWRPGGSHEDPRARFKIPRDEKRRRFRERLFREDTPEDREVPVRDRDDRPPRPEGPRPTPAARPGSRERPPRRDGDKPWRKPQDRTGPGQGSGPPSGRKPGWKPNRPSGTSSSGGDRDRGWKPNRPHGQGSGSGDRGWKPSRPQGERTGTGDRGWKPNRPKGEGTGTGDRGWKPNRPPREGGGGGDRGWKPNRPPSRPEGHGGERGRRPPGGGRRGGGGGSSR